MKDRLEEVTQVCLITDSKFSMQVPLLCSEGDQAILSAILHMAAAYLHHDPVGKQMMDKFERLNEEMVEYLEGK